MAPADALAYMSKLSSPPEPGAPFAVTIPGSETPNRTAVYRNFRFRDSPLLETLDPTVRTLHDAFESSATYRSSKQMLGWRPWNVAKKTWEPKYLWMTYAEVAERRKNFGAGIVELHKQIGVTDDKYGVGLWSQNRPEWQIAELGLMSQSLWNVSLYETLGPDATEYIINHGQLVCVIATLPHIATLLKLGPRISSVKLIVCIDALDSGEPSGYSKGALLRELASEQGVQIYSMAEVEEIGARSGRTIRAPAKEDITTINYTSGTTGDPKGVVLTHGNMVASTSSARASGFMSPNDTHISYLPLAHIYGRMADWSAISLGARIGYFHGDMTQLVEDLKILRPTGLFSVPRLYNRFHSAIQAATVEASGVGGALSRAAVAAKMASMQQKPGQATNWHPVYDRIWSPKVRRAVGLDRAVGMVTGSAQLDPDVQQFLRAAFGIAFVQGYGMTETSAVGSVQVGGDFSVGNIGGPQPGVEFCIESVPDLEYTVEDRPNPRGELLMRGPIVFREYFRNEAETARVVDAGTGWFHSGDIVEVDSLGRFKIIDRRKNVLKLAQGEYVSPERIENVYIGALPVVATAFVHGDGIEASLVAVLGIEPDAFAPFASKLLHEHIVASDVEALRRAVRDPRVRAAVQKQVDAAGRKHKFNSFERVRSIYLAVDPFTIENELLTPTLKLKRPQAARAFRKEIDEMYAEIKALETNRAKI
ncbi:long-chain-fatty-acid-ligase 1 [Grosmannia clavigera kw1407]|uniref:Long-chain-fatty-acid-ligase 1 n=1 Tax=Grosmannia clavigera (strain kw1407 / UAMH 11150) TaxID=655863 RepID=F0XTR8_GROCL|nr:long-chain-fatty-acid-ligase 1 [Grosmannia clavigera kw1407]EFW98509.1 long-chain-fatty-acid-ligase 1 [Grosmannia clavigera kw1407]